MDTLSVGDLFNEKNNKIISDINNALIDVEDEVYRARALWRPMLSAHDGYALILEELEELKAYVFTNQNKRNLEEMRKEAIQVAAMAIRFIIDICDNDRGRI